MKRDESKKGLLTSVINAIKQYGMIQRGDGVVVAVSGGPDSTALMHILNMLKDEMGFLDGARALGSPTSSGIRSGC